MQNRGLINIHSLVYNYFIVSVMYFVVSVMYFIVFVMYFIVSVMCFVVSVMYFVDFYVFYSIGHVFCSICYVSVSQPEISFFHSAVIAQYVGRCKGTILYFVVLQQKSEDEWRDASIVSQDNITKQGMCL